MLYLTEKKYGFTQSKLVSKYIACVNPENVVCKSDKVNKKNTNETFNGDSSRISKIMSGEEILKLDETPEKYCNNLMESIKHFNEAFGECFSQKAKQILILSILELIENFKYCADDVFFKTIFMMTKEDFLRQKRFVFPEVMIRTLLYTVYNAYDNADEYRKYANQLHKNIKRIGRRSYLLTKDNNDVTLYISQVAKKIDTVAFTWDDNTQTLSFDDRTEKSEPPLIIQPIRRNSITDVADHTNEDRKDAFYNNLKGDNSYFRDNSSETERYPLEEKSKEYVEPISTLTIDKRYQKCQYCQYLSISKRHANLSQKCNCTIFDKLVGINGSICEHYKPEYSRITVDMLKDK